MDKLARPNTNTSNDESLPGVLGEFLHNWARDNLDDMLPARVVSYDRTSNRAVVQPLVMVKMTGGEKFERANLANIPVFRFGGGGFFISANLKAGDIGWIKANDKDISLVLQRGGDVDIPNTKRIHKFSDGMFFPDVIKGWLIDGKNSDALVIQSLDGSTCIAIDNGRVEIDAENVIINCTKTTLNGDLEVNGSTSTTGNTTTNGSITTTGDVTADGISLISHTHSGVVSGGENTGTPNQ